MRKSLLPIFFFTLLNANMAASNTITFFTVSPNSVFDIGVKLQRIQSNSVDAMVGLERSNQINSVLFSCFQTLSTSASKYWESAQNAGLWYHLRNQLEHPADRYKVQAVFKVFADIQISNIKRDRTYLNQLSTICNNANFSYQLGDLIKLIEELDYIFNYGSRT